MSEQERFELFVCPQCGHWVPARSGASFYACDGSLRVTRTREGYFSKMPMPHEPVNCERIEVVPATAQARERGHGERVAELREALELVKKSVGPHLPIDVEHKVAAALASGDQGA